MTRPLALVLAFATAVLSFGGCVVGDELDEDAALDEDDLDGKGDFAGTHFVVIGAQETFLKQRIRDASGNELQADDLPAAEKCRLPANTRLEVQAAGTLDGTHVRINTRTIRPGCAFSQGYLYVPHIAQASFPLPGKCAAAISRSACAFLGTIAYAEGTGERYDLIFGYRTFTSYANHPRRVVCSGGYCSDAAGRYQILSTTWDGIRSGLPDFGPASQDQAALRLLRNRGVTNVDAIDTYGELSTAIYKVNREWASLPGSPYGQPTKTMDSLWREFRRLRGI